MIVLDTCTIIWDALETIKITPLATKAIKHARNELIICDISFWEISMLIKRKHLEVDDTASGFINLLLQSRNFHIQEITPEIAELSVNLGPEINNDPADRLIAATSILRNAPIITADQNLIETTLVETIW
jgi:PIN domain nuclease of toxin-antitoxin system